MIIITAQVQQDIFNHARQQNPLESCGLVVMDRNVQKYLPCRNINIEPDRFLINPKDWTDAQDAYDIIAVVHSHVNISPKPSEADRVRIEDGKLPWIIINYPTGRYTVSEPCGYEPKYVGRPFIHGVLDCYALIRDYYRREFGIILDDYDRDDEWWLKGQNMYLDNFASQGFVDQSQFAVPQIGDVILMQIGSPVPNHGAIYYADGQILHHLTNKLSNRTVYGGYWRKSTTHILRHKTKI